MAPSSPADGRFAPSPTGPLHLGNLRTALLAWLFARSAGGRFVVRLEDLDAGRVRRGIADEQLDDLRALGVDWDEPVARQSERLELYAEALATLEREGLVFPCYCTRAEVRAAVSAPHGPGPLYPGTCRRLTRAERSRREAEGRRPALRFRVDGPPPAVEDQLLGPLPATVDDFVVRRGDGAFAYNLAVVVDDAAQGIGQVVRGADLADTTARQVALARAVGVEPPRYAHVPLVLGPDGRRLAKRHGAVTLADRRAQGESPAEVRSWLAETLGLAEPGEIVEPESLLERFAPARLPREPTRLGPGAVIPAAA